MLYGFVFIALGVFLLIFGHIIFFWAADLRQKRKSKKQVTKKAEEVKAETQIQDPETDSDECEYSGKPLVKKRKDSSDDSDEYHHRGRRNSFGDSEDEMYLPP